MRDFLLRNVAFIRATDSLIPANVGKPDLDSSGAGGAFKVVASYWDMLSGAQFTTGKYRAVTKLSFTPKCEWRASAVRVLADLSELPAGWDSYGAPAPTLTSINAATRVLAALEVEGSPVPHIAPSREGGVTITLAEGGRIAVFETTNDGELVFMLSDSLAEPVIEMVAPETGLADATTRAVDYISAEL